MVKKRKCPTWANHSTESVDDDELENEEEMTGGKKKRAKLALKDFAKDQKTMTLR